MILARAGSHVPGHDPDQPTQHRDVGDGSAAYYDQARLVAGREADGDGTNPSASAALVAIGST
jgi:hypothetical protein